MNKAIFELHNVRFSYLGKFPALCGIDITIEEGRNIAVIGANGSGKSTLLHILDALIFPDEGSVKFLGNELKEGLFGDTDFSRKFRRTVGMVFQNPDIQLFCPTVKEEILFGPLQLGFAKKDIAGVFDSIVELFGIKDLVDRMPHQLSIGEKRKVAMASVFISGPNVILLDEPTAGLDPKTSRNLIELLKGYHRDGKTVVTATHDMHIVEEMAQIVHVFSRDRQIIRSGEPAAILADTPFLQENNLMHVHAHKHAGAVHVHPHDHPSHDHSH